MRFHALELALGIITTLRKLLLLSELPQVGDTHEVSLPKRATNEKPIELVPG